MPAPTPAHGLVPVRGKYVTLAGAPAAGSVVFHGLAYLVDAAADTVVVPTSIPAALDATGAFTVDLPATDDPDITPTGWTYAVRENITGQAPRTYHLAVPLASLPAGIDLSTVAPADPATGGPAAYPTLTAFAELEARTAPGSQTWTADPVDPRIAYRYDYPVDVNSSETLQVWVNGIKRAWLNEWGGYRAQPPYGWDAAVRIIAHESGQTGPILQYQNAERTVDLTRIAPDGSIYAPNLAPNLTVGAWTPLTGWQNGYAADTSGGWYTPAYRIRHGDTIELRGRITTPASISFDQVVLTGLPVEARPGRGAELGAPNGGPVTVLRVLGTGEIRNMRSAASSSAISLDGLSYSIAAP